MNELNTIETILIAQTLVEVCKNTIIATLGLEKLGMLGLKPNENKFNQKPYTQIQAYYTFLIHADSVTQNLYGFENQVKQYYDLLFE